jgi:hypothetical protein
MTTTRPAPQPTLIGRFCQPPMSGGDAGAVVGRDGLASPGTYD